MNEALGQLNLSREWSLGQRGSVVVVNGAGCGEATVESPEALNKPITGLKTFESFRDLTSGGTTFPGVLVSINCET